MIYQIKEETINALIYLKRCPFCGELPNISYVNYDSKKERYFMNKKGYWSNGWIIECKSMGCIFSRTTPFATIDDAVKKWNARESV